MDQSSDVLVQTNGPVISVTLTRPTKRNALTGSMVEELRRATAQFETSDDLRVLLVKAEGAYFSAGADIHGALFPEYKGSPSEFRRQYAKGAGSLHLLGDAWEAIEKPVVVVHQGPCLGGALELSLCADFRIASDNAAYELPEIAFGGLPGSGGISRLTRLVGPHWARWLVLAQERITAHEALNIGMIHRVVAHADLDEAVAAFCTKLAAQPKEAFAAGKCAIELTRDLDRHSARNVERLAASSLVSGAEFSSLLEALRARFRGGKGS
ncbi:MAG: enoyl-CoA hydratase/isomerase family protein [Caulobacterales bacterium]